jgi:hypothetical protein
LLVAVLVTGKIYISRFGVADGDFVGAKNIGDYNKRHMRNFNVTLTPFRNVPWVSLAKPK